MPENIIAKKIAITLDTIKQVQYVLKNFVAIVGDSIEITVNLTENDLPKDITGCTCRLIGVKSSGEYFEQNEDITIDDALNGVVKIYPKLNIFNVEGKTTCCLLIEDTDETINVQRFVVAVSKSLVSDIIDDSKEDIETLKELNNLLNTYRGDLNNINQSVSDMEGLVVAKTNEVSVEFNGLKDNIQNQINVLQDNIDGINDVVNYQLTKAIKLTSYNVTGSNYIYMQTETLNFKAEELLKRAYDVFIGGKLESDTYNTALGKLTFYKQNGKIYPFYLSLSDRSINSKTLSPMVVYGDLTNEILPTTTGFKIMVKSNIPKALNGINDVICHLTPLGQQ